MVVKSTGADWFVDDDDDRAKNSTCILVSCMHVTFMQFMQAYSQSSPATAVTTFVIYVKLLMKKKTLQS